MTQQSVGFFVRTNISRPNIETLEAFQGVGSANASDAMQRANTMHHRIKPVVDGDEVIIGPAVTVRVRAGDNLMLCKALTLCQPGDVLVVAATDGTDNALWGGVLSSMAAKRGVKALVTDGLVRDLSEMRRAALPVWAAGRIPTAPTFDGKGEVNTLVSCGGIPVSPGDIVIADADGVAVVPLRHAAEVAQRSQQVVVRDTTWLREVTEHGSFSSLDRLDDLLREKGCVFEE